MLPLAPYAAQHWLDHAKREDVVSRIQEAMKQLFKPQNPYLASWTWIHDVDRGPSRRAIPALSERRPRPRASPLYYAVLCGFSELAEYLIVTHQEDVDAKCGYYGSQLHAALYMGHLDSARVLLDHGADKNLGDQDGKTPLAMAVDPENLEAVRCCWSAELTETCRTVPMDFCYMAHRAVDKLELYACYCNITLMSMQRVAETGRHCTWLRKADMSRSSSSSWDEGLTSTHDPPPKIRPYIVHRSMDILTSSGNCWSTTQMYEFGEEENGPHHRWLDRVGIWKLRNCLIQHGAEGE